MGHRTDKTRSEDLTTDERANRHPNKANNYTEDAQNVMDDNLGPDVDSLSEDDMDHARNKATEGKPD
ncbi:MAG TPA: hypothetical protein VF609_16395 [Flavisolibacter sp.]|jgi:hypothetical protein